MSATQLMTVLRGGSSMKLTSCMTSPAPCLLDVFSGSFYMFNVYSGASDLP